MYVDYPKKKKEKGTPRVFGWKENIFKKVTLILLPENIFHIKSF